MIYGGKTRKIKREREIDKEGGAIHALLSSAIVETVEFDFRKLGAA